MLVVLCFVSNCVCSVCIKVVCEVKDVVVVGEVGELFVVKVVMGVVVSSDVVC